MKINELVKEAYENAVAHGWHETPRNPLEVHMLIVSEIAEATEAVREGSPNIFKWAMKKELSDEDIADGVESEYYGITPDDPLWNDSLDEKPEGEIIELADAVIRIMDYFGERGWDLEAALRLKMDYNKTREYRHGGKKA